MPQFEFGTVFIPQLFWLAVFFVVLYFGIVRLTLPRLGKVMDERIVQGAEVVKTHTEEFGTFQSPNWGPLGIVDHDVEIVNPDLVKLLSRIAQEEKIDARLLRP